MQWQNEWSVGHKIRCSTLKYEAMQCDTSVTTNKLNKLVHSFATVTYYSCIMSHLPFKVLVGTKMYVGQHPRGFACFWIAFILRRIIYRVIRHGLEARRQCHRKVNSPNSNYLLQWSTMERNTMGRKCKGIIKYLLRFYNMEIKCNHKVLV